MLRESRKKSLRNALIKRLIKLNNEIFTCFLEADYPHTHYLYEHRLHRQKNKCMRLLLLQDSSWRTRIFCKRENSKKTLPHYLNLYSMMLDYAQLRYRVGDHTIFDVCRMELIALCQAINKILQQTISFQDDLERLREKIDRFEDIYQHVLRVTARDPVALMLFINSLKLFAKEIELVNGYE